MFQVPRTSKKHGSLIKIILKKSPLPKSFFVAAPANIYWALILPYGEMLSCSSALVLYIYTALLTYFSTALLYYFFYLLVEYLPCTFLDHINLYLLQRSGVGVLTEFLLSCRMIKTKILKWTVLQKEAKKTYSGHFLSFLVSIIKM